MELFCIPPYSCDIDYGKVYGADDAGARGRSGFRLWLLSADLQGSGMNQKLEDVLQLALQTPEETRRRTEELNIGFDGSGRTWELIVKYHGSLAALETLGITVEYLIAGYALLTAPEELVGRVAEAEEIEYVEKPKRFFYEVTEPVSDSCILQLPAQGLFLSGRGVLMMIADSGIGYRLPVFRRADGSTRIRYLWDQTVRTENAPPPEGFRLGSEFTGEQINAALQAQDREEQLRILPTTDTGGHGTAVAGIAAGYAYFSEDGAEQETFGIGAYRGVAPEAELLIVKLGLPDASSFPRTTEIMRAVTWALRKAQELEMPLVINLSFGNSYGAHDGSSLLERFLDNAAEIGRTVICVGSGNDGASAGHLAGRLGRKADFPQIRSGQTGMRERAVVQGSQAGAYTADVELAIGEYERNVSLQLWKNYSDAYEIRLRAPDGQEEALPMQGDGGKYTLRLGRTEVLVYIGEPKPYEAAQEIYLEFLPEGRTYLESGIWTVRLSAAEPVTGQFYFYLPCAAARSASTGFYFPTPDVTLTIPSTAAKVVTVGAYDSRYDAYADFSGRGYADAERTIGVVTSGLAKPDFVAPGVDILAPDLYGSFLPVTGTSFATPIASGAAALLMEWGIVQGNDPFLYGEKVKAYLRRGARPLRGEDVYPNAKTGWGKLCVAESIVKK